MSRKHCLMMESVSHEVVECILERLPEKSKQWKSMIESPFFQKRQLINRQQSGDADVLMYTYDRDSGDCLSTLVLGSLLPVEITTPSEEDEIAGYFDSANSCDGLVCFYDPCQSVFVVNTTTRWYRTLPLLKNATTCEVFDFQSNAWRYVTPATPYRVDVCNETKVLSFNLHTEAFQVISKASLANALITHIIMCNLDNRLCVSLKKSSNQVMWLFNSGNKTWDKLCSIHLDLIPYIRYKRRTLVTTDKSTRNRIYHDAFLAESIGYPVCYFPTLSLFNKSLTIVNAE
ncbi:hypothetical protein EUTSA_v10026946mg, partial [Eutrema salsugineum]